ncbi:type II secretion system protein GspG [Agarilytica rhodophyticola]|uniref:type II secretion system protein GspG n=1 Tax=Agarilytica rhodophyticola TaxID=1737490 RepID=UPI000B341507|nr:type II secretion system protein GspG [Agarilytica rhodophyticola]
MIKNLNSLGLKMYKFYFLIFVLLTFNCQLALSDSRGNRVQMDLNALRVAVLAYEAHCRKYPQNLDTLFSEIPSCDYWKGPYLSTKINLVDPWGESYMYFTVDRKAGVFFLLSKGKDNLLGSQDDIVMVGKAIERIHQQ